MPKQKYRNRTYAPTCKCRKCGWRGRRILGNSDPCSKCGGRVVLRETAGRRTPIGEAIKNDRSKGRPYLKAGQRTLKVFIGFPEDELRKLDKFAAKIGKLRSTFIRDCVRERMKT